MRVVERIVHGGGSAPPMMLTRTNYSDWAMITKLQLQADELWHAVKMGQGTNHDDRRAMSALLKGVRPKQTDGGRTMAGHIRPRSHGGALHHLRRRRAPSPSP